MRSFLTPLTAAAALAGLATLLSCLPVSAQEQTRSDEQIRQQYAADRAECMRTRTGEDLKACLREAGAAQQAARQGKLLESESENYRQNALARCAPLPEELREACRRRILGEGTTKGSVVGGGIYRELTVQEPAAATGAAVGPGTTAPTPSLPSPSPTAPSPSGAASGPTFTPVQPTVPGRMSPAGPGIGAGEATRATPSARTHRVPVPSRSLEITPPATPVTEMPPPLPAPVSPATAPSIPAPSLPGQSLEPALVAPPR